MFSKTIYTLRDDQNVLVCKSADIKPIPEDKQGEWIIIETDTGKIYTWDGTKYVDKTVKIV